MHDISPPFTANILIYTTNDKIIKKCLVQYYKLKRYVLTFKIKVINVYQEHFNYFLK